jgi:maltose-binding protein MalE
MEPSVITLTIWTTEELSPTQVLTSGLIMAEQAATFEAAHPETRLQFIVKKPYGKGGILDFLLNTQAVVPQLLPDLVIMDVDELHTAVQAGLAQPLDGLLPTDLVSDLYPFARNAATVDDRLYGLQIQADFEHLAYDTGKMAVPPSSWPGVLSNPGPYIFPAGGQAGLVNDAFMMQYLSLRPWPSREDPDAPFLDAESLTAVLQYYQDGASRGIFPAGILDYHTTAESWGDYLEGQAAMTHVSAHQYLGDDDLSPGSSAAPIPAINGGAPAFSQGWGMVLIAVEPEQRAAAIDWMVQLMAPETNAALNRATDYLPTRQAALVPWDQGDSYTPFAHQQLQIIQPFPTIPNYALTAGVLQEAVEDVLSGSATPEEAASQAIESAQ